MRVGSDQRRAEDRSLRSLFRRGAGWFDRAADLVDALALRGEELQGRQRTGLKRRPERLGRRLALLRDRLAEEAEGFFEGAWHALGVPTRSDLEELSRAVERLTRAVERLVEE